jgi:uncharacterized repeat protein (TIGR01451 family)
VTLRRFALLFTTAIAFAPSAFAIVASADVSVSKSGPATVSRSANVTYGLTVTNNGPSTAASVQLTDPLPPGITFVSLNQDSGPSFSCSNPGVGNNGTITCTLASMSSGATATFTLIGSIPSNAAEGSTFDNTATVTTTTSDPNGPNNSSTSSATVVALADIGVIKSGPATAAADTDVPFDITVTNSGPDDAMGVALNDNLPAGMTFVSRTQNSGPTFTCTDPGVGNNGAINCTIALMPAGSSANFTFVAHIAPATAQGTTFTNVATVSSQTPDPNGENDTSSAAVTVPIPQADLGVQKSGPASAMANTDVSYTITVFNNGPNAAANVTLTDALPGTMTFVSMTQNSGPAFNCSTPPTCTILSLLAGQTATFTLTGHIPSNTPSGTIYTNTATVSSDTQDDNPDNNTSSALTTVSSTDLSVTKTGPANANAGGTIVWTITVTNNGPDPEDNAVLNDTLPNGTTFNSLVQNTGPTAFCNTPGGGNPGTVSCFFPTLGNGTSAQFTLTANVSPSASGSINNTATVTGANADPNLGNNSSTWPATVTTSADLTINKSAPVTQPAGTDMTYTITLTNSGPSNAANVSVTDAVPANTTFVSESQTTGPTFSCTTPAAGGTGTVTCNIASFGIGSATFSITVHIGASVLDSTSITNTANVSSSTPDPNPSNNSSTKVTVVGASADISVVKTAPAAATAGTTMTYNITVTNNGTGDSTTVTMSDTLPPNTTFVSETQPTGPTFTCSNPSVGGTGTVSCSIAVLTNGTTATFAITVLISPAAPIGPSSNTATVASIHDPNAGNDSSTAITQVGAALADLSITKTPSAAPYGTGALLTYTIVVTNLGPNTANAVTVTDVLPPNTTFVAATPGGLCSVTTTTLTCTFPTLANGATGTVTLSLRPTTPGPLVNTATVSASAQNPDPNPGNNTATSTITVIPADNIPMISPLALLILCIALAIAGAFVQRT